MKYYGTWWQIKNWYSGRVGAVRHFFASIKDVVYWTPIVWRNAGSWSGYHALDMFYYKIVQVRETMEANMYYVGADKHVKRIKEFEQILRRILQEKGVINYEENYYRDYMTDEYKACWLSRDLWVQMKHSNMLEKQDLKLLGTYFEKYFTSWEN